MKKIFLLLLFLLVSSITNNTFADKYCESKSLYPLYKCRNTNICTGFKPKTMLYDSSQEDDYEEIPDDLISRLTMLPVARKKYVNIMNKIYLCGTMKIEINALDDIITVLLKIKMAKEVDALVWQKFKKIKNETENRYDLYWCKWVNKKSTYSKLDILKQTTWETCQYRNYLEYLRELNTNIETLKGDEKSVSTVALVEIKKLKDDSISKEIAHIYKVFPAAFHAYSSYENNYVIHLYLQLLKADFIVLRQKLNETLWPINQVVYKILNAMSL